MDFLIFDPLGILTTSILEANSIVQTGSTGSPSLFLREAYLLLFC